MLQRQVRVHPLELGVFSLELPQLSHIRPRRAPVLAPPLEECRLADAVRPSQVRHGHAALGISQDANDLGLTEPRLPHDRSLDQSSLRSTINRSGKLTARRTCPFSDVPIAIEPRADRDRLWVQGVLGHEVFAPFESNILPSPNWLLHRRRTSIAGRAHGRPEAAIRTCPKRRRYSLDRSRCICPIDPAA